MRHYEIPLVVAVAPGAFAELQAEEALKKAVAQQATTEELARLRRDLRVCRRMTVELAIAWFRENNMSAPSRLLDQLQELL